MILTDKMSAITPSKPYDCDAVYDSPNFEVLPCVDDGPRWYLLSRQILWSIGIWFVIVLLSKRWSKIWHDRYCDEAGNPPLWVQRFIGTPDIDPLNNKLLIVLELGQLVSCAVNIYVWVVRSYALEPIYGNVDIFFTVLSCLHSFFMHVKWGFSVQYCFKLSAIIDCVTIPGILLQGMGDVFGGNWLTLAYLRAYAQKAAFSSLCEVGVFDLYLSDFSKAAIIKVIDFACIIIIFLSFFHSFEL